MAEETTTVTFNQDVYPYVFGDVVELSADQLKAVDADAKRRGLDKPYTKGVATPDRSKVVTPTGDSDAEIARASQQLASQSEAIVGETKGETATSGEQTAPEDATVPKGADAKSEAKPAKGSESKPSK